MIAETNIDESLPKEQFRVESYEDPYCLDKNCHWDELLIYVKSDIPTKELNIFQFEKGIEYVGFEIKLCKKKLAIFSINRVHLNYPLKHQQYFLT